MIFKCKICGGSVQVDRSTGVVVCDYCGTKQTLPQFTDESSKLLYESGNTYLQHSEYDKAETVFNQLLSVNPQDSEIHWSLVMCRYGVTFVCDPQTGKYIPTCNRTHYNSIFHDAHYQSALRFSDDAKKEFYQVNADTIDKIQRGILTVSQKEKPFDIFISYKDTASNGGRTKESIVAQELYEKLTKEGYKVFFSRITLENKIGSEYEPYIYAALSSSKVMLTISASRENVESVWVKNEWSRFLTLRQEDSSKSLIPLYFDMEKSELPDEFAIFASQDITKEGYEQELIRGIKKLIPLPIMLAEKRKKRRKAFSISMVVLLLSLGVACVASIPYMKKYQAEKEVYNQKMKVYEEAMKLYYDGNYPEAAWAFRDMDGFEDSVDMQKKAELKWRESLATVATDNLPNSSSSQGSYYISANGTVENFNFAPGTAHQNIEINEHGKIVSIADNYELYALHEDGFVTNSAKNNRMESDWENAIQITSVFNATNVALMNDGTVCYGNIQNIWNEDRTDEWLVEVASWENIVSLSWSCGHDGSDGLSTATIVGIQADGDVRCVFYEENYEAQIKEFIESLHNIKKIAADSDQVIAVDASGVVYIFADGEAHTYTDKKVLDVELCDKFYILDNNRCLSILGDDKVIMEDAVYVDEGFWITRSGTIYRNLACCETIQDTSVKTQVKDVWLEGE